VSADPSAGSRNRDPCARDDLRDEEREYGAVAMHIDIEPIGVVRSTLRDRQDAPRQAFEGAPNAILEIDAAFAPALSRVTAGMELIVLTWLHEADRRVLEVHPMDDERIPLTGVFATRSSDRPNPIGLHRVTVLGTGPPTSIHVDSLEAIDGTPILDLKVAMKEAGDA
jgi:tRNA-Thr(GGU) m(6)t(6)A37 methyltransferase TsaA